MSDEKKREDEVQEAFQAAFKAGFENASKDLRSTVRWAWCYGFLTALCLATFLVAAGGSRRIGAALKERFPQDSDLWGSVGLGAVLCFAVWRFLQMVRESRRMVCVIATGNPEYTVEVVSVVDPDEAYLEPEEEDEDDQQ